MTDNAPAPEMLAKAATLIEALPYLQDYAGSVFVVKYGGHAMASPELAHAFAEDIVLLKAVGIKPVVIHGGGPQIGAMLDRLNIHSSFVDGLRVTDAAAAEVVEMVLGGINKGIAAAITQAGGHAVGLSGRDANMVRVRRLTRTQKDPDSHIERIVDLGFVGEPEKIDMTLLNVLTAQGIVPVVAPLGQGPDGHIYNINADTMAGAVAAALGAARLFLLTDVPGVLDQDGRLLTDLTPEHIARLKKDGVAKGGMIPKLDTCVQAVEDGVKAAVILDGRIPHAMLLEIFTSQGAGTLVKRAP